MPLIATAERLRELENLAVRDPEAAARVSELARVDTGSFAPAGEQTESPLRVVVWNLHRGRALDEWIAIPAIREADLLLLCEVDSGMARSGNINVTAELARRLSLHYAYTPEYFEFTRGTRRERNATQGGTNAIGLHGNAILSRWPLRQVRRAPLPIKFDWYPHFERRIGTRVALIATLELPSGPLDVVSTHLEAFASPRDRAAQIAPLFDALPYRRAIIGGDLNTLGVSPNLPNAVRLFAQLVRNKARLVDPVAHEPLFAAASAAGFEWALANTPDPTWRPHALLPSSLCPRLDWALLRGVRVSPGTARVVPALARPARGRTRAMRLSDHDGVAFTAVTAHW